MQNLVGDKPDDDIVIPYLCFNLIAPPIPCRDGPQTVGTLVQYQDKLVNEVLEEWSSFTHILFTHRNMLFSIIKPYTDHTDLLAQRMHTQVIYRI